eukprot:11515230-Alexandrium_andersonii.AAC.1
MAAWGTSPRTCEKLEAPPTQLSHPRAISPRDSKSGCELSCQLLQCRLGNEEWAKRCSILR